MKSFKVFFENFGSKVIVYHVSTRRYLHSIKKNGLVPKIPEDYGESGDQIGIYCFPNMDEVETAMYNWLGERIEEWEEENQMDFEECLLTLDITGLQTVENHTVDWEIIVKEPITPDRILSVSDL